MPEPESHCRGKAEIMTENANVNRARPIRGYYHICSDGNSVDVLFRNETDFVAAMNRIAACSLRFKIVILAFVLMHNHFHFVIQADSEEEAIRFVNEFKRLTGQYIAHQYGQLSSLVRLPVKIIPVPDDSYLKTLIAYVVKNPTQARLNMFFTYPWGTGSLYFCGDKHPFRGTFEEKNPGGRFIREICRTHESVPAHWRVSGDLILPENYVAVEEVEQLYKTARSYMFFLSLNKDEQLEKDYGEWNEINLSDTELRAERIRMTKEMFGTTSLRDIPVPDRVILARQMRRKFLCSKKQIARIVHLPYEAILQKL